MRNQLSPGTYRGRASRWEENVVNDKPVLQVYFNFYDVEGSEECNPWTCWMDDLFNDKGEPSANLKGLQSLGVTEADVQGYLQTGRITGLDRNEVNLVVEENRKGYSFIKYVNTPGAMRQAQPLGQSQRASVAQRMLAALRQVGGATQPPQTPAAGPPRNPDDDIPF